MVFVFLVGVYYTYIFLLLYINYQKDKIAYVLLGLVADYMYIADLILELRVGWKTLPK